jgi:4-amino-4-deoxy-L-arabinose transferase-like glycosyltransferase
LSGTSDAFILRLTIEKSKLTTVLMKTFLPSKRYALIIILALAIAPYFIKLGTSSLWDANEAFYAETPREMLESGDYLNPSFNYKPRFNKPPLCYWIVAASYNLFGVSENAERLPLALGALVMIAVTFFLGRAAYSTEAGLIAAIALASTPRFLMFSRRIMIDVYIAMFMSLTLLFFLLAERYAQKRKLFLVLMYVCVGLGIMTKGPVAAALPTLAFIIYFAVTRQLKNIRRMMLPTGALIVATIVLPWYMAVYWQHGWIYIKTFLLQDNISRYTQPVWGPRRGPFFYLPVILGDLFPWSLFLFFAILALAIPAFLRVTKRLKQQSVLKKAGELSTSASPVREKLLPIDTRGSVVSAHSLQKIFPVNSQTLLLFVWVAVIVIFYSLSSNKEDLYISPVYAAAAAIIGILLAHAIFVEPQRQPGLRWLTLTIGVLLIVLGISVVYLFGTTAQMYQLGGATYIGFIAAIGGITTLVMSLRKKSFAGFASIAVVFVALNFIFVLQTLPDFERYKAVRTFSEVISKEADDEALVGYYKIAFPSMVFYLQRQIFEYYKPEELAEAFASDKKVFCIMSGEEYEAIKSWLPSDTRILASRPVFQVKLKSLLDRRELPKVVLISNK